MTLAIRPSHKEFTYIFNAKHAFRQKCGEYTWCSSGSRVRRTASPAMRPTGSRKISNTSRAFKSIRGKASRCCPPSPSPVATPIPGQAPRRRRYQPGRISHRPPPQCNSRHFVSLSLRIGIVDDRFTPQLPPPRWPKTTSQRCNPAIPMLGWLLLSQI